MPVIAMRNVAAILLVVLGLTACASYQAFQVVQMPQRAADLYPSAQTRSGMTIAVDEINSPIRVRQYFGADLLKHGILPVNIVVANYGEHRATIKPSDILVLEGRSVVDPLPVEAVATAVKRYYRRLRPETEREIDQYLAKLVLRETQLVPGESHQGVLFFPITKPDDSNRLFKTVRLFPESMFDLLVGVTDTETRARLRFGPFHLFPTQGRLDPFLSPVFTRY